MFKIYLNQDNEHLVVLKKTEKKNVGKRLALWKLSELMLSTPENNSH